MARKRSANCLTNSKRLLDQFIEEARRTWFLASAALRTVDEPRDQSVAPLRQSIIRSLAVEE